VSAVPIKDLTVLTVAYREGDAFLRWLTMAALCAGEVVVLDNSPGEHAIDLEAEARSMNRVVRVLRHELGSHASLADVRNLGISLVGTEWMLALDDDEFLPASGVEALRAALESKSADCWFTSWITYDHFNTPRIFDYKLTAFRPRDGVCYMERTHQSPTLSARRARLHGKMARVTIEHHPRRRLLRRKKRQYLAELEAAWGDEPCPRIQWFLANTCLQLGDRARALQVARLESRSHLTEHPVESVNLQLLRYCVSDDERERSGSLARARELAVSAEGDVEYEAFRSKPYFGKIFDRRKSALSALDLIGACHCIDPLD
jgi:hypothetical protein